MAHLVRKIKNNRGFVLVLTIFIIALSAALIIGFLQVSTTDLQIVRNDKYSKRALYIADAGIEDAMYQIKLNNNWNTGFSNKAFAGETYTVTVTGTAPGPITIDSTSTVSGTFQRHIRVEVVIYLNSVKINYWKEI